MSFTGGLIFESGSVDLALEAENEFLLQSVFLSDIMEISIRFHAGV